LDQERRVLMEDIHKIYPDGVEALRGVTIDFKAGEVHGLLGENGAGKSTLMRILFGQIRGSTGRLLIGGEQVDFRSPRDAIAKGIGMVFQHFMLVSTFSGLENILLGFDSEHGSEERESIRRNAMSLASRLGLKVDLDAVVENMPMGERQRIEILKLLLREVDVLILDEPTSNLTPFETDELLRAMRKLRDEGKTLIFVTHKLREALSICDRITVMRKGLKVDTVSAANADLSSLARMMVGKEVILEIKKESTHLGSILLEVRGITVKNDLGKEAVKNVSFDIKSGEILGIAGVAGNGQKELVEAITGLRVTEAGNIFVAGVDITKKTPGEIYELGLSHIPEDRFGTAVIPALSVKDNLVLGLQFRKEFSDGIMIRQGSIEANADKLIEHYSIMGTKEVPVKSLSGGNIQRVVIAREFSKSPSIIVASQPTTGLDIGATEFVRNELLKMRDNQKAILLVSSELEEVLSLSDRVAIMYEGGFMGVKKPEELTEEKIGLMMGGVKVE